MKIENVKEATVTTNLSTSDVTDMSIDLSGIPHLMNILTNLYNNPTLAVVREYFTNALDAQTRIGTTSPVKVTMPSWDSPVYVVQDFGVGMSPEDIRNTYARYGASTKRESNDEIGAFGLGCKSALTISNQFTVISIKDGHKTSVLISKSETGINTVNIISILPTEEPTGTTVKIPVPDVSKFIREAKEFFKYTTPSRVLIDGSHPDNYFDDLKLIPSEDGESETYVRMSKDYWGSTSIVVTMGEVPYSVAGRDLESIIGGKDFNLFRQYPVYVKAAIGSVDLTPNREGLRMTDKTTDFIKSCYTSLRKMMQEMAQKDVDAVENRGDIQKALNPWKSFVSDIKWKGEDYLEDVKSDNDITAIYKNRHTRSSSSKELLNSIPTQSRSVVFIDLETEDVQKVSRSLSIYMKSLSLNFCSFYFAKGSSALKSPWITGNNQVTLVTHNEFLEACKAQRKVDRANRQPKTEPSKIQYPVIDTKTKTIELVDYDKIPAKTPYLSRESIGTNAFQDVSSSIFNYIGSEWATDVAKEVATLTDAPKVSIITGSRTSAAYATRVKDTYDIVSDIEKKVEEFRDLIKDEEVIRQNTFSKDSYLRHFENQGLDKNKALVKIKDPELVEALKARSGELTKAAEAESFRKILLKFRPKSVDGIEVIPRSKELSGLTNRYPLITGASYNVTGNTRHSLLYVNAVYDSELAESNDS